MHGKQKQQKFGWDKKSTCASIIKCLRTIFDYIETPFSLPQESQTLHAPCAENL